MDYITWSYCSSCKQATKHTILFSKLKKEGDEIIDLGESHYQVIECNGCETISFRREIHDFFEIENGENEGIQIEIFPCDLDGYSPLTNTYSLPKKIRDVYNQTLKAFKGESFLLTGVGFRAIIEAICIEEKIKGNNLEQKINNLVKNKLITEKEADRLHSIRFLGNDAVHEMEIPTEDKLYLVLSIIEHLLKNLYLIDLEIKNRLDTVVKDFKGFEDLLFEILPKFKIGEERNLKEILGKHKRQIKIELPILEQAIIDGINKGIIDYFSLGKKQQIDQETYDQYFIVKVNDFLPF